MARLMAEELYGLSTSPIYNDLVVAVAGLTDQHECLPFSDCHRKIYLALIATDFVAATKCDFRLCERICSGRCPP